MPWFAKLLANKKFAAFLWFGLSLFAVIKQALRHNYNNYLIYKFTFINLLSRTNLYLPQPQHFSDSNHYGLVFAIIIAPFTLLPDGLSVILWTMVNAGILYYAIQQLPLTVYQRTIVVLLCAHELMTSSYNVQFNPSMAAIIMMSFVFIKRQQDFWAALLIVLGTYVKLYGIVGLAFFFFSEHKLKFTGSLVAWALMLFVLPMLFSSPAFVIQTYYDWYNSLREKNSLNTLSHMQDISVMGMIRRIFSYQQLKDIWVLIPAVLMFSLSYIRVKQYKNLHYQLLLLASTLIFTVIFSTSSESPTYIIAFVGVAIWFVNLRQPLSAFEIGLMLFAFLITSLSPSDLFPQYINRNYIKPYSLKAFPCLLIWLRIMYEILTNNFKRTELCPVNS